MLERIYLLLLGNASALKVGECYHYGKKVNKDLKLAMKYYYAAAAQGEPKAYEQLYLLFKEQDNTQDALLCKGMVHEFNGEWQEARAAYEQSGLADAWYRISLLYQADRFKPNASGQIPTLAQSKQTELHWLKRAAIHFSKQAINRLIEGSQHDGEIAYLYAQLLEQGEMTFYRNIPEAIKYYLMSGQLHHREALNAIERLVEHCSDNVLLQLVALYKEVFSDLSNALKWLVYLAEKSNANARTQLKQLENTPFTAYKIGESYELSNLPEKAIPYYLMACRKGIANSFDKMQGHAHRLDVKTKFELADLCIKNNKPIQAALVYKVLADAWQHTARRELDKLVQGNADCAYSVAKQYDEEGQFDSAYSMYLLAIEKKHPQSDQILQLIRTRANGQDPIAQYYLGCVYYTKLKMMTDAILWAMLSAEKGYKPAQNYLDKHPFSSEITLLVAQKYESGDGVQQNGVQAYKFYLASFNKKNKDAAFWLAQHVLLQALSDQEQLKAYDYLTKAALWQHVEAQTQLQSLAEQGILGAQYLYGCEYLHHKPNHSEAIRWALLAASKGHERAEAYLRNTIFSAEHYKKIARHYACGQEIREDIQKAIFYYNKAVVKNDQEAAVELAQLFLAHDEVFEHQSEAFLALVKAVQLGHKDSLATLESLAPDADPELLIHLGDLYQHAPFINEAKAIYWFQQARDYGCKAADLYLAKIKA